MFVFQCYLLLNIKNNVLFLGMMNFLNCVTPLAVQTTKYQQSITDISNKLANLTKSSVTNTWNCVIKSFLAINFAESINCFTIALTDINEFAKSTSQTIQNLMTDSRNMVLQLPSCSTKTMLTTTQNANALLQNIISCASGKGVNATLPSVSEIILYLVFHFVIAYNNCSLVLYDKSLSLTVTLF